MTEKIKTIHIASGRKPLCGASAHMIPEMRQAHGHVPHGVNCLRCIKSFDRALRGKVVGTRRDMIIGKPQG